MGSQELLCDFRIQWVPLHIVAATLLKRDFFACERQRVRLQCRPRTLLERLRKKRVCHLTTGAHTASLFLLLLGMVLDAGS